MLLLYDPILHVMTMDPVSESSYVGRYEYTVAASIEVMTSVEPQESNFQLKEQVFYL